MANARKVDLVTNSPFLEDVMLSEYPFQLLSSQYRACRVSNGIVISQFEDLEEKEIVQYLDYKEPELSQGDCYELRDALTGDYLRLRAEGRVMTDRTEIQSFLEAMILPGRLN